MFIPKIQTNGAKKISKIFDILSHLRVKSIVILNDLFHVVRSALFFVLHIAFSYFTIPKNKNYL